MRAEDLQVGDQVVVERGGASYRRRDPFQIHTVARITKTQITLDNDERYMKSSGRRVGDSDSWYTKRLAWTGHELMSIQIALEENKIIKAENHHRKLAAHLKDLQWRSFDLDILLKVRAIIKEA